MHIDVGQLRINYVSAAMVYIYSLLGAMSPFARQRVIIISWAFDANDKRRGKLSIGSSFGLTRRRDGVYYIIIVYSEDAGRLALIFLKSSFI